MRGIVVGTVLSLILWAFIGWCGVCACNWLQCTAVSGTALALVTSLACIVCAGIAGYVWLAGVSRDDDVMDPGEHDLVTFD